MIIPGNYVSDTLAGNANQTLLISENPDAVQCGLVFIKVFGGGSLPRIFGYQGIIDSTYADGKVSKCNDVCAPWKINSLGYTVTDTPEPAEAEKNGFLPLTFDGKTSRVISGEKQVFTDPVEINAGKGRYICLKTEFSGEKIPFHPENITAIYTKGKDGTWSLSPRVPLPVFTGVKRKVKKRIAFIGDSITQGIGTDFNSYRNYAALAADKIGAGYAYWNLGIGYSRAADAAADGVWLERAKQNDIITVCFGVNDIFDEGSAEQICANLLKITSLLQRAGLKVLIQTVPPFEYEGVHLEKWLKVNSFIRTELSQRADGFLDAAEFLGDGGGNSPVPVYGCHPDNNGNTVWAEKLVPEIEKLL